MKLLFTKKELNEAVSRALTEAAEKEYQHKRFEDIERRLCDLDWRLSKLEHPMPELGTCNCEKTGG